MIIPRGTEGGCLKTANSVQCSNGQIHETVKDEVFATTNDPLAYTGLAIVLAFIILAFSGWMIWGNGRKNIASAWRNVCATLTSCLRRKSKDPSTGKADIEHDPDEKPTRQSLDIGHSEGKHDRVSVRSGAFSVISLAVIKEEEEGDRKQHLPDLGTTVKCEATPSSPGSLDSPKDKATTSP
ncbi:hypothetical protein FRC03_006160 [Tulasnella sp. 419]|nr:hypothetical protein FRC03_006160 [Tulasnella sp. 419]